jgi:hypothetical protein
MPLFDNGATSSKVLLRWQMDAIMVHVCRLAIADRYQAKTYYSSCCCLQLELQVLQ